MAHRFHTEIIDGNSVMGNQPFLIRARVLCEGGKATNNIQ